MVFEVVERERYPRVPENAESPEFSERVWRPAADAGRGTVHINPAIDRDKMKQDE